MQVQHDVLDKFGKKAKKKKPHGNLNGKSSSRKMREVQNIVEKMLVKKHAHNIFFKKIAIQFNDINHASSGTIIPSTVEKLWGKPYKKNRAKSN